MKKFYFILSSILIALGLNSCDSDSPSKNLKRVDIKLSSDEKEIALNQYEFPVKLLAAAYENGGKKDIMISPLSAEMVLGMLTNAVDQDYRNEALNALNLKPEDLDAFNAYMQKLLFALPDIDKKAIFNLNNAFWAKNDAKISDNYYSLLTDFYAADINRFDKWNLSVLNDVNNWVNKKTKGAIPEILHKGEAELDLNTVWVDALYFKGEWTQKFDKQKTKQRSFYPDYPEKTNVKKVNMMEGDGFRYRYDYSPKGNSGYEDDIVAVMLPYGNESYIFTAILPSENNPDILSTLNQLNADFWKRIDMICSNESKKEGHLKVRLPKINSNNNLDLIPILKKMGLNNIFNFVSMNDNLGYNNQWIGIFRQNLILDLDEEGTELKVATVAGGGDTDAGPNWVYFDRPFIYFIRERSTGAVLLAGVYVNP